jgi:hypothetical protein
MQLFWEKMSRVPPKLTLIMVVIVPKVQGQGPDAGLFSGPETTIDLRILVSPSSPEGRHDVERNDFTKTAQRPILCAPMVPFRVPQASHCTTASVQKTILRVAPDPRPRCHLLLVLAVSPRIIFTPVDAQ